MRKNSHDARHYDDKLKYEAEDSLRCQIVVGLRNVSGSAHLQWMIWFSHAIQNTVRVRTHGQRSHEVQSKQRRAVNHCFSTRMCNTRWKHIQKKWKKRREKKREKRVQDNLHTQNEPIRVWFWCAQWFKLIVQMTNPTFLSVRHTVVNCIKIQ